MKIQILKILVCGYITGTFGVHRFKPPVVVGDVIKKNESTIVITKNVISGDVLNAVSTMSKRIRSKSLLKPKKVKRTLSPNNIRSPIPRSCKYSSKSNFVSFDYLSLPSNKVVMGSKDSKVTDIKKEKKKEESDEELDVVFDLQEEKKNKVYEVITVMSDDETPNKITYERIYAENPEDRIVENPESSISLVDQPSKNVEAVKEPSVGVNKGKAQDSTIRNSVVTKVENNSKSDNISGQDSDDEIVCVAVIDAKTKADMKKKSIEEICLSSDSDSVDSCPSVPPLRLKIPAIPNNYNNWSVDRLLESMGNDSSFGTNDSTSPFSLGYRSKYIYPYVIGKQKSNVSQSLSSSSSPKHISSDELSLNASNSIKNLSDDESATSVTSGQSKDSKFSAIDEENISSSSSSDEENQIYWKADRLSRRKGDLMYEEFTKFGRKLHQGEVFVDSNKSVTFKVMSYNVLAQNLLEEHRYLYTHHDPKALVWSRRWTLIFNEIKEENPEILCLQEVEHTYLISHYAKLNDLGYRWIYKKRTNTYKDGVAIFYKAEVFEEEEHAKVEYYQPGVSVLDRDNVGLVIKLRLKKSPSHAIVVSTTHLLYNPRRSDVKLAQVQMLLAEIDRLAYNKNTSMYYPVILTGDFNLRPRNGVYKLLTEGMLVYEGMSRRNLNPSDDSNVVPKTLLPPRLGITSKCQHVEVLEARTQGVNPTPSTKTYHSELNKDPKQDCHKEETTETGFLHQAFNFKSVYPHVKEDGQKEASTHHDHWITVDYIFYSSEKGKNERNLQLISRLRLPTQNECERLLQFLPNFAFGSDHLPLVGKFLLQLH